MNSTDKPQQSTIVCLPAYNEESSVEAMVKNIQQAGWNVFITDGGSVDKTVSIAVQLGVTVLERPGKGKGFGMKQAINFAANEEYDIIVFIDCDMTYPTNKIEELVALMSECDMVIGARRMGMITFFRRVANYLFTGSINILYGAKLKDTQSGLRAMRVKKFKDVITTEGFDVETEITCTALKRNYKIREVDIDYYPRIGSSKIKISDSFFVLCKMIKTRLTTRT